MTAAAARTIWQLNQDPAQYSAYVPDTEAGITLALQESGVEAVALPANGLAVLDQYSEDNIWTVEVWGPFFASAHAVCHHYRRGCCHDAYQEAASACEFLFWSGK
jgi:hypothetical protein